MNILMGRRSGNGLTFPPAIPVCFTCRIRFSETQAANLACDRSSAARDLHRLDVIAHVQFTQIVDALI
ncbi:MAG TPA: hypothetical protein VJQ25_09540, partial [Nitrospira sp.]|nr:hypothetical protein [Nitrospira sp.]